MAILTGVKRYKEKYALLTELQEKYDESGMDFRDFLLEVSLYCSQQNKIVYSKHRKTVSTHMICVNSMHLFYYTYLVCYACKTFVHPRFMCCSNAFIKFKKLFIGASHLTKIIKELQHPNVRVRKYLWAQKILRFQGRIVIFMGRKVFMGGNVVTTGGSADKPKIPNTILRVEKIMTTKF